MSVSQESFRGGCESHQPLAADLDLTQYSKVVHICNPSAARNVNLPDARTLKRGQRYLIVNLTGSGFTMTLKDNTGTTIDTLSSGAGAFMALSDNTTQAGQWFHIDGPL